jgi:hypothetical protein
MSTSQRVGSKKDTNKNFEPNFEEKCQLAIDELVQARIENDKLREEMNALVRRNEQLERTAESFRTAWRGLIKANRALVQLNQTLRRERNLKTREIANAPSDALSVLAHMPGVSSW